MKFIHIADVHLGAKPDGWKDADRGRELWESMERLLGVCGEQGADLLLIAGDLFHRQPLLRELRELNFLFSRLTRTRVVFVAGNHDYLKPDSYYRTFRWNENVYPLLSGHMEGVEFPDLETTVYGLSYHQREIREPLYDVMRAPRKQKYEILLAHGGDEKHIPMKKDALGNLGYAYIAMGHIHKPQTVLEGKAAYAGALEPVDVNDTGKHGYISGEITERGTQIRFVPFAKRAYLHLTAPVDETSTNGSVKEEIRNRIRQYGPEHAYKCILRGVRSADVQFDLEEIRTCGNVFDASDETRPAYDLGKIARQNQGNLLGRYIESFAGFPEGSIEYEALHLGVQALLETKRGAP